eukprot:233294-Prymnesium_polylepis.1
MIVAVPALLLALPKREFNRVAIFTRQTAQVCTLAVVCPALCSEVGFTGKDFDPSLLSLVVATPTAFSINAAYQRRERALQGLADMRAASWNLQQSAALWGNAAQAAEVKAPPPSAFTVALYRGPAPRRLAPDERIAEAP